MYERKDYVTRTEIDNLSYQPGTFAQYMDSSDLERVVGYFVDELRRRQEQKRLLTRICGPIARFLEHNRLKSHPFSIEIQAFGFQSDCRGVRWEACDLFSSIPGLPGWSFL